jgi:hypothetical protein
MASLDQLRAAGSPLVRAVIRSAGLTGSERHPLTPAAVRVERTRARRGGETADQTAVTVWLGEGPSLPVPGLARSPWRTAAGVGMTLLGAAALAAASTLAAQREQQRRLAAARPVESLAAPRPDPPRAGG